jgi:hypothetical protein
MTTTQRRATTVATLAFTAALTGGSLLAASQAQAADTAPDRSKAAIEHDEQQSAGGTSADRLTKAQIEHREAAGSTSAPGSATDRSTDSAGGGASQAAATGGDAAAWQLAASAALGALVTGAAFVGARQVAGHRPSHGAVTG